MNFYVFQLPLRIQIQTLMSLIRAVLAAHAEHRYDHWMRATARSFPTAAVSRLLQRTVAAFSAGLLSRAVPGLVMRAF